MQCLRCKGFMLVERHYTLLNRRIHARGHRKQVSNSFLAKTKLRSTAIRFSSRKKNRP